MTPKDRNDDVRQEEDVLPARLIFAVLGGTLAIAFVLGAWAWATTISKNASIRPSGEYIEENLAKPHAVSHVVQDLFTQPGEGEVLNAQKRRALEHWSWVDRDAGVVRMPIEEAMGVLVEEGSR